ncbi:MAG TPA: hypothetical protein VF432_07135 [Thermoanaerobaculia bacterium]
MRAVLVDQEQRAARGEAASVRHGEVVHGDQRHDERGDDRELTSAESHPLSS